jgi:hypothetical protein
MSNQIGDTMADKKTESLTLKLTEDEKKMILFAADEYDESAGSILVKALSFYLPLIKVHPIVNQIIRRAPVRCQQD